MIAVAPAAAMLAALCLGIAMTRGLRILTGNPPAGKLGRHRCDARRSRRRPRIGDTCQHCTAGILPDRRDCPFCDGTSVVLYPRGMFPPNRHRTDPGGADALSCPSAPSALIEAATS